MACPKRFRKTSTLTDHNQSKLHKIAFDRAGVRDGAPQAVHLRLHCSKPLSVYRSERYPDKGNF